MFLGPRAVHVVLRAALLAVVVATFTSTRADPDLWGHVRFGRDTIAHRGVSTVDSYSFTSDRRWINHEWLAECVMYVAYGAAGGTGLVGLKLVLLVAMMVAIIVTLRLTGLPSATHDPLIGLALVATIPQANDVRPQLFSLVLFAWLLVLLVASRNGRLTLPWLAVPMMAIWANLHGGWIVGAGTLVLWAAAGLFAKIPTREKVNECGIAVCGVAATLANPYGSQLWAFLRETVAFGRANIVEWQSILQVFRIAPLVTFIWVVIAAAAVVAARNAHSTGSLDSRGLLFVVGLGAASFRVNRLLAFFAIAVVTLMGPSLVAALGGFRQHRGPVRPQPVSPFASGALVAIGIAVIAGGFMFSVINTRCIVMDPAEVPESEAVALVQQRGLRGRMITWFNWGEYAIWHLAPAISVSMDGRRETIYSDGAIREAARFYTRPDQRQPILDHLQPDYIWLPPSLEVVRDLQTDGWATLFSGSRSVLLGRKAASAPVQGNVADAPRCFPGP